MSTNDLEQHLESELRRLADPVGTPPTSASRAAVGRRTAVLRRRQRTRRAIGSVAAAAVLIGGAFWLRAENEPDVETIPPARQGDDGRVPAFDVDALDLTPHFASETTANSDNQRQVLTHQRFVGPNETDAIELSVMQAGDPVAHLDGWDTRTIDGQDMYILEEPRVTGLMWSPRGLGDIQAEIAAYGVDHDDLVKFVEGLKPLPDESGLEATDLPDGFRDVTVRDQVLSRRLDLRSSEVSVVILSSIVTSPALADVGCDELGRPVQNVSVLELSAVLVENGGGWCVSWRDGTIVIRIEIQRNDLAPVERSVVADITAGIHELPEEEWQTLLKEHGG